MAADSVAMERSLWNMSQQLTGHHVIEVNTLIDSTPWTGRGDNSHHTVSKAWCLDVNSLSTDVYPLVFDNARVNRSAEMSPNPTPLPKRSLNPRTFYFCTRTEQVSSYLFNFHVQFTNKNVGSLWWSLKTTRHSCVAGGSKQGVIKTGARGDMRGSLKKTITKSKQTQYGRK